MYGCVVSLQQSALNGLSCTDKHSNGYYPTGVSTVDKMSHESDDKDVSREDLCLTFNVTSSINVLCSAKFVSDIRVILCNRRYDIYEKRWSHVFEAESKCEHADRDASSAFSAERLAGLQSRRFETVFTGHEALFSANIV